MGKKNLNGEKDMSDSLIEYFKAREAERYNVVARVGNFEIVREEVSLHSYLRIKTVSGDWGVSYRDDNEMYGKVLAMRGDEGHLGLFVTHIFYATSITIDVEFALDYVVALERMRDRMVAHAEGAEEQSAHEEALEEMETLEDIREILSDER